MLIEYSNDIKGEIKGYWFYEEEKEQIVKGLIHQKKQLLRKIERIRNHPKNEGQAKYSLQISSVRGLIQDIDKIINKLSKAPK